MWTRTGSHRFPGDPSYAFALLQDPGRAGKISPWRSCRCCPRATQAEGLNGYIISRLTQGLSIRCLRFTSGVTATHARLASGWRAAPLPGGGRTLWIASKGFRLHSVLLSRTSPVARVVYAKPPFAGPEQVLGYLARYTHRVAIANSRLIGLDDGQVSFTRKDYRQDGETKVMRLAADEFIRRFLQHTVPDGFHRIRHIGFLANRHRTAKLTLCAICSPRRHLPTQNRRAVGRIASVTSPATTSTSALAAAAGCCLTPSCSRVRRPASPCGATPHDPADDATQLRCSARQRQKRRRPTRVVRCILRRRRVR